MARRGRRQDNSVSSADTIDNARPEIDGLLDPLPALPLDPVTSLDEFTGPSIPADRRAFSFDMEAPRGSPSLGRSMESVAFENRLVGSDRVRTAVCVRRQERREVLHAMRKVGRGRGYRKRTWRSDIKC